MKRTIRFAAAIIALCTLSALSSCSSPETAAPTEPAVSSAPETTAAQTTATASSEKTTTTTAASTSSTETSDEAVTGSTEDEWDDDEIYIGDVYEYDSDPAAHPIRLGVWLERSYDDTGYINGCLDRYFIVEEGGLCMEYCQNDEFSSSSYIQLFRYAMSEDDPTRGNIIYAGTVSHNMEILENTDDKVRFTIKDYDSDDAWIKERTWTYLSGTEDFSYYSNAQLVKLAEHHLCAKNNYTEKPVTDISILDDDRICIAMRVDGPDGNIIDGAVYYVNRYNLMGHDADENDVYLRDYTEGWDDMPEPYRSYSDDQLAENLQNEFSLNGAAFGVWYLGRMGSFYPDCEGYGFSFRPDYITHMFASTGAIRKIPGLRDWSFSSERFIGNGGDFCLIIPADKNEKITVTANKIGSDGVFGLVKGRKTLYSSSGECLPTLVCFGSNPSPDGTEPDVAVTVTGADGKTIEWRPRLDPDGKLIIDSEYGSSIHDFTDYSNVGFGLG